MPEIIASLFLLFSLGGLVYLLARKIPLLLAFPAREQGSSLKDLVLKKTEKLTSWRIFRQFTSPDLLLQKLLSKTRIAALKTESKTGQILEKLRKKSQEKNSNSKFSDENYWKQLRRKK